MPSPEQMEKLARERARHSDVSTAPSPDQPPPPEWWESVLTDPRRQASRGCRSNSGVCPKCRALPQLECLKYFRGVEIQRIDAVRLWPDNRARPRILNLIV
jgi:hypothetical protein